VLFEREARVLASLDHRRIPKLESFFVVDDAYYLVQEYVEGRTLDAELQACGRLPEAMVRRILAEVLDVLEYLHARSPAVVHRDIKPSNLILGAEDRVYVIDFGAVREAISTVGGSAGGSVIGTPGYMPLEQLMGSPVPASDLYALGATALHLVSGTPPDQWHDKATGRVRAIAGRIGCSPAFEAVLSKMLAQFAEERFARAADVRQALGNGESSPAVPAGPATVKMDSPVSGEEPELERQPGHRPWRRRGAWAAGVLATVAAAWAIAKSDSSPGPEEAAAARSPPPTTRATDELDRVAAGPTNADMIVRVNHPASWQVTTGVADRHLGIRDPTSGTVLVTGIERFDGPVGPSRDVATALAANPGNRYGTLGVTEALQAGPGTSAFRLEVVRGAQRERGTIVLRQFTTGSTTLALWWMILGSDSAGTRTAGAMAQTIVTADAANR
jgi:hypothetical protein